MSFVGSPPSFGGGGPSTANPYMGGDTTIAGAGAMNINRAGGWDALISILPWVALGGAAWVIFR